LKTIKTTEKFDCVGNLVERIVETVEVQPDKRQFGPATMEKRVSPDEISAPVFIGLPQDGPASFADQQEEIENLKSVIEGLQENGEYHRMRVFERILNRANQFCQTHAAA